MKNPIYFNMKKIIITVLLTIFVAYCVLFPKEMAAGATSGLTLWYQNVVPTLLPFSILSYIIIRSDLYHALFYKLDRLTKQKNSFQLELLYPIFFGFLCGFPIGAKLIADLYETKHITGHRLTLYTAVCNQFGPAFVISYIGGTQLNNMFHPGLLIVSIYLPSVILFFILLFTEKKEADKTAGQHKKPASRSCINFKIIDTGIINGFETMLRIAGYIVLFSILSRAINLIPGQHSMFQSLVTGLLEVTTGVNMLVNAQFSLPLTFCIICGIVSFGGLCGLFQTKAIMKNCPFHTAQYLLIKILCAFGSTFIASALLTT